MSSVGAGANASDVGLIVQGTLILLSSLVAVSGYFVQAKMRSRARERERATEAQTKLTADALRIAGRDVTGESPAAIRRAALEAKGLDLAGKSDELSTQLKTFKEKRAKVEADPGFNGSLEFASEQLKLNGDAKLAVKALDTDKKAHIKVYLAERVHKRLMKLKKDSEAQSFKEKAQKLYLWSPYFEGKHMADK